MRNWSKRKSDERAEMGVGTMIIFIAMVLVAAVAASVMISTANNVREQAQSTGDQAIDNVATGFIVQDVVGRVNSDYSQLINVTIYMRLASGSPAVNMDNVIVSVTDNDESGILKMNNASRATASADVNYGFEKELDVQVFEEWVLGQGDLAKITIVGLNCGYNENVEIKIIPAYGQMNTIMFTTPDFYSTDYITLA
jgi:archaeal flagellin FlaB